MEQTKGELTAEAFPGSENDPTWIIQAEDNEIVFQTVGGNDKANAQELVRRWNAFEKDGLVDELRAALKKTHKEGYVDGYVDGVATDGCVENNIIDQDDWAKAWNQSDAKAT